MKHKDIIIGIDSGSSNTKVVGVCNGDIITPMRIKSHDKEKAVYEALEQYITANKIAQSDIKVIMLTGVGCENITEDVLGVPTKHVGEFDADIAGAMYGAGVENAIVVSMGTGTTIIEVKGESKRHLGGLGMGGGTLCGLSRLLLGTDDISLITALANEGNLSNIDTTIGDICTTPLPGLPLDTTASLFDKADKNASKADIALGLIHAIVQTICSGAYLASLNSGIKDFVMIGNLTLLPQAKDVFNSFEALYGVRFIIPKHSAFATAIGAALS